MKRNRIILLIIVAILSTESSFSQEQEVRKKLVGSWIYSRLEYDGQISSADKLELDKAAKMNKDLILTFEGDGSYLIWNKQTGKKDVYASGKIKLTNKGRHLIIEGLEGDIDTLNNELLMLSYPDRPKMVFIKYIVPNKN